MVDYPRDWSVVKFEDVTEIANGQVDPTIEPYIDYPHIGPENIIRNTGRIQGVQTARELGLSSGKYLFDENAVVYSKIRPNLNKICIPDFVGICSADVYPIWVLEDKLDKLFLFHYMLSDWFLHEATKVSGRTGLPKINRNDLNKIRILLPPLAEQKAIAQILGTWDEAIAITEALIEALTLRKRALMQRLLTGEVRFPGFDESDEIQATKFRDIPADWDYVQIKDVAKSVSKKNNNDDDLTVLSCTKYDGLVDSLEYFGRKIYSDDLSTYKIVKRNQFAYATNHIEEGSIGYQDLYDKALISPMYTVFETIDSINDSFLYRVLKTELYRHIFEVNTSASVNRRGSLRWNQFSLIKIPVPSIDEQKVIAHFFNELDELIFKHEELHASLQEQKRGLMQVLLSGQVRVGNAES